MAVSKTTMYTDLTPLLRSHELHAACKFCCKRKAEITFCLVEQSHHCQRDILLARQIGTHHWRPINPLPEFPRPMTYEVCWNFKEGSGCTSHGKRCSFARSSEEASVWNFMKVSVPDIRALINMLEHGTKPPVQSHDPTGGTERILSKFLGKFLELCKTCFHSSPQRISRKQNGENPPSCTSKHPWKPLLIHCKETPQKGAEYHEIRQLPNKPFSEWRYCRYVSNGEPCWHGANRCWFAHSEVEMAVWTEESKGQFHRSRLLGNDVQKTQRPTANSTPPVKQQTRSPRTAELYCKVCRCKFRTQEDYMNHCFTSEHRQRIFGDGCSKGKHRDPPQTYHTFKMCQRPYNCEFGDRCLEAHSEEELQEWRSRARAARKKASGAEDQGLLSYQDRLLEEYRTSSNPEHILSETVSGVKITCDPDLFNVQHVKKENVPLKWKFTVESENALAEIALLKQEPGASFTLGENSNEHWTYSTGVWYRSSHSESTYEVTVSFISTCPGVYEQWLVFDFDTRPVLLQKILVRVGMPSSTHQTISEQWPVSKDPVPPNLRLWNRGNRVIVPYFIQPEADLKLLKEFEPPAMNRQYYQLMEDCDSINHRNYKERMHSFLYQEEQAEEEIVCRLNIHSTVTLSSTLIDVRYGLKIACDGELFGSLSVCHALTPDTPEGFMLKRWVQSVLVGEITANDQNQKVYEALILKDTSSVKEIHLKLSRECCSDLGLQKGQTREMEVQFQLNRVWFCEMHKAIDLLPDLQYVLPDFNKTCVPVHPTKYPLLNEKQQAAMGFILGKSDGKHSVAPLLIYGPFGTGKTFTLATAAVKLMKEEHNRVLICTHTNSSADLYVKDHFYKHIQEGNLTINPLRIKAKEVSLRSTDPVTMNYCLLTEDGWYFKFPDKDTLDLRRIVITTTGVARLLHDLKLPENYFSHIMIDEASQMLECEALMALSLAGPKTRVVLAGDHMQMGPKLFSVEDHKRSDHTLLNRLFYYYQSERKNVASESRVIFNENYRSTKGIVDFVSTYFYFDKCQKKQQTAHGIKSSGDVAAHPRMHPLVFSHVRGECHLDTTTMSWYNPEEIAVVVEIVKQLLQSWPVEKWKEPDPSAICILSQGAQVYHLRNTLKQVNLHRVTVENAENVQGKQFRVIIIVTVHTRDTIKPSASNCLEFFNDARVLNTAMTRAQSQVIIVGDVAALCYFGKCAKTWRCYVEHCIENNSAKPEHLTKDFLNQEVMEVSRFVPTQEEDTSDTDSTTSEMADIDPILKELLDESIDLKVNVTEEGLLDIFKNYHPVRTPDDCEEEYHRDQSDSIFLSGEGNEIPSIPKTNAVHKRCTIVMERYDLAYAIPLDEPTSRINITGRKNVRCCFPDDEVLVEVLNDEITPPTGRVHSARAGKDYRTANKLFICTIEKNDNQVMTPINKCISKIYTPFWKDKPHHIAVRKPDDFRPQRFVKITEDSKRNHLFVVQVLKWRENFRYPLGIVVEVLPKVTSLEAGLDVLHIEHELQKSPSLTEQELQRVRECSQDLDGRKDFRNIITFTIDPSHSRDHDDAISVRDLGLHYEIGIHIADVAHFVPMGSQLDEYAKQQGLVFYPPETTPVYIFPRELSEGLFSLLPGCDRHTISLMVVIEKATDLIKSTDFHLSVIHSDRKLSYGEAEQILQNSSVLCFNTVEGCLRIASHFSKIHRKNRKQGDWCYKSPDEDSLIGSRQSHRVVEELMILFNNSVAQLLLKQEETKSSVPLRCQDRPDLTLLGQLRQRCRAWLPMSIHLSHLMEVEGGLMSLPEAGRTGTQQQHDTDSTAFPRFTNVEPDTFSVLTSLLENLQTAANEGDIQRVVDLITTDDVHPQLLPIIRAFRKLIRRAHVIRSNSSLTSRVGHFDLDLDCYSWASSPIRRYVDIITHRILHSVLEGKEITYSPIEIDRACVSFSLQYNKESKYERTSHSLNLASKLKEKSARKIAYITDVPPNGNNFRLSFPLLRQSICDDVTIMYRDLQLADQPAYDRQQNCCIIKWIRRVYSFLQDDIHFELKRQVPNSLITQVSREAWEGLLSTIREEKWGNIQERVKDITSEVRQERTFSCGEPRESRNAEGHFVELSLRIKQGGTIEVQLGTDTARGMLVPAIQLLIVNPNFEICLEHTKNPVECFSKYALRASKDVYPTYNDYQNIWTSLCEMESACNAVSENESIVLEDVELTWTQERGQNLQGFFWLPLEKKKKWAIECDLRKCLLCVRMRQPNNDFQPEKKQDNTLTEAKYLDLTSMTNVIWIAHGVTTEVEEKEEDKDDTSMKIHFCINHLPMTNTPQRIFLESTRFTVELIPKLLPDVRKEETIKRLTKANKLVKCITLGKKIDLEGIKITANGSGTFDMPQHHALGFPPLNRSQTKAIRETLHNHFTLIQGPPGTGKTVVGVHIVYWFFMQSKKEVPRSNKKDRTEEPKKGCILYCGPSNKSVDVVAGQLLKLSKRGVLRPLRVYSEQMEVLEYPYPGSSLKLSRHSLREGKPNQELRSITLHHRMRMPENPHSSTIRAFDVRIRRGDDLSDEEIKSYKRALQSARKHELLRHDVILCTCTAASNPNFTKAKLNPQQIIIDECAMATEPEALIPLVTHQPEQIVLIGDHKQLKPVVSSEVVERLGMGKSLFERYMRKALMLDIQYRMHEDICEFPSQQFYGGHLKTGRRPNAKPSVLLTESENLTAVLFGHVEGKEVSLIVATEKGNENSRANIEEAEQTVRLATLLIYQSGIDEEQIAILTPYNAQVAKIKEILSMKGIYNVTVSTIMKSQGSEWRYVILSTVRSCPESEIDNEPTKSWLMKKLGFVMDPNQVNVGITRAQEGLCIIGNQTLLRCSHLWRKLLNHYYEKECVVNPAQRIHVQKKQGGSKNKVTNFTRLKK